MHVPITEAEARVTHTRGRGLTFLRSTLKVTLTGSLYDTFMGRVSPEARACMERTPQEEEWVPTPILGEINEARRDLPHADTRRVRGELIAEKLISPDLLKHLPKGDPRPLLRHFAAFWSEEQRGGLVTLDLLEAGESQISIWAIYPYLEYHRDVLPAYMHQALVLVGAQNPKVDYLGPGEGDPFYRHRYWLKWMPEG